MDKKVEQYLLFFSQEIIVLWQELCESHNELLKLTTKEYHQLLSSELEELEATIQEKKALLERINLIEAERLKKIDSLNEKKLFSQKIESVNQLISLLREHSFTHESSTILKKQNKLLINIIQDIRLQNKKNQNFIVKAIDSIKKIKEEMFGKKTYSSYGPKGSSSHLSVRP